MHLTTHNSNRLTCSEMTHFSPDSSYNSFTVLDTPSVRSLSWQPIGCWHYNPSTCVYTFASHLHFSSHFLLYCLESSAQEATERLQTSGTQGAHQILSVFDLELSNRWIHTWSLRKLECLWASRPINVALYAYSATCTCLWIQANLCLTLGNRAWRYGP